MSEELSIDNAGKLAVKVLLEVALNEIAADELRVKAAGWILVYEMDKVQGVGLRAGSNPNVTYREPLN